MTVYASPETVKLEVGETKDVVVQHEKVDQPGILTAHVHKVVTWSSDDDTIATVASSGLMTSDGHTSSITAVTGVASGTTFVTADPGNGNTATIPVEVAPENTDPLVIRLAEAEPSTLNPI